MIAELQRIVRRARVRPWPILALALLITGALTYKFVTKPHQYVANVVLALDEGASGPKRQNSIPFDELSAYVSAVLLPDGELAKLVERRTPHRIDRVGAAFAIQDFRETFEIEIWRNSFLSDSDTEANVQRSVRIGLEVTDFDPDQAYEIAHDLAGIIIQVHEEQRKKLAGALTHEAVMMRDDVNSRLAKVSASINAKQVAFTEAKLARRNERAAMLAIELTSLKKDRERLTDQVKAIVANPEQVADLATAAGLGTTIHVVEERRPDRPEHTGFTIAVFVLVVGTLALVMSTLLLGTFDSRIHDVDDAARLGLPILGHVPGFPGDHVGSLDARGGARARVPSFLRWRSYR